MNRTGTFKKIGLWLPLLTIFLAACSPNSADGTAKKMFEDLHGQSVYYVAQNETASLLGTRDSGESVVQVCYEIRRDLGAPFKNECAYVTMQSGNEGWQAARMYDGNQGSDGCWTPLKSGKEILASTEWLDRKDQALAAPDCP